MSDLTKCNQVGCEQKPAFRLTWPGKDEAAICNQHAEKAIGISEAMGFYLQLIPLDES